MNYKEFITHASQGKKLREKDWPEGHWVQMRDDGSFVSQLGQTMHLPTGSDVSQYEIYIEPVTFENALAANTVQIIYPDGDESDDPFSAHRLDKDTAWDYRDIMAIKFAIDNKFKIELS